MSAFDDDDIDWSEYEYADDDDDSDLELSLSDYVALFIAALETIFFPLVVLGVFLVALAFLFAIFY